MSYGLWLQRMEKIERLERMENLVPYEERMKFSIAEKICKDKNYVEIRRFFEEGDNLSLNKIIGISCRDGLLEILMYILEYDENLKLEGVFYHPFKFNHCLYIACSYANIDIVRYLLSRGMDSQHLNISLGICTDRLIIDKHRVGEKKWSDGSAGYWDIAILLLENGADVNYDFEHNLTLIYHGMRMGNYEGVKYLYDNYSAKYDAFDMDELLNNFIKVPYAKMDEHDKILTFLIRNFDIDKFFRDEFDKDEYSDELMVMIRNERKRRKQIDINNLLLICKKKKPELHPDELEKIISFF